MPFKSEKQRRYLWATQPDLAKRWAHKYPESNKGLPMYANKDESSDSKEKAAQFDLLALIQPYVYKCNTITSTPVHIYGVNSVKSAADKLTYVDIPHSDKPTYAGQEREEGEVKTENNEKPEVEHKNPENAINSLLQKLSVVLSQPMAQILEDRKAVEEGREPAFQPKNPGIRRYAAPVAAVPPPMGSPQAQAQQPAQPQPAQQQGAGMNSPSANPIQSFGPLSASGNINGNAAFGQKNSPDSLKTAAGNPVLSQLMSMDYSGLPDADDLDIDEEYMKTAGSSPAWQRSAGKNDEGGLNAKGRASYNKATGGNLKPPVTESNPSGDRAKRQNSFCSRMCGMKKHETGAKTKSDPDSRINKSLRKWNCKCSSAFEFGEKLALYRGLRDIPTETGPEQMQDALFRFNQLRALARPSDNMLKGHNLSRKGFQHEMRRIATSSQDKDRFELSKIAPNPKLRAAIAGAAGLAGTGLAAYAGGGTDALAAGVPLTALAAGGAYLHGQQQRKNLKNTAKLLKNYGLLNPKTLRQAYPLLGDDYRLG